MKKRAFGLIFSIVVTALSLIVCLPKNNVYASQTEQTKTAHFLLNETPYESDIDVGTASGYDEYLLGEENIKTIEATANAGFKIVGWRLVFGGVDNSITRQIDLQDIESNSAIFKDSSFVVSYISADEQSQVDVSYEITYQSKNSNNLYYDYSTIKPSKIAENVKVEPVFDYVYTNLDVSSMIELSTVEGYQSETISEGVLKYKTSSIDNSITKYQDSYLFKDEKYYYFGEVFQENGEYFTLNTINPKGQTAEKTQRVPVACGKYRLGEQVEYSLDVDFSEDMSVGKNVDIHSLDLKFDNTTLALTQAENFVVEKDAYGRSKQLTINFDMPETKTLLTELVVGYDNLYVATISVDVENEQDSDTTLIYDGVQVTENSYYTEVEKNKKYLVKNPKNSTNALGFKLTAIKTVLSEEGYNYFVFKDMSCEGLSANISNNVFDLSSSVDKDFEIVLNYAYSQYQVEFKFGLYDETSKKFQIINGDFNVETSAFINRGETQTFNKTNKSINYGYTFVGFVEEKDTSNFVLNQNIEPVSTIEVGIDEQAPSNKIVYMLFKETLYSIKLNNYNQISLTNKGNIIYPCSNKYINVERDSKLNSYGFDATTSCFNYQVKVNDKLNVELIANQGFNVFVGFGQEKSSTLTNKIEFELSQAFLKTYDDENTTLIDLYVFEEYVTYTFTFTLNAIDVNDVNVFMADLEIVYDGVSYTETTIADLENASYIVAEDNSKVQIVLTNLRRYTELTLISRAKEISAGDGQSDYYQFIQYTENYQSSLSLISQDPPTASYSVQKDNVEIFAVYTLPGLKLSITIDNEKAYDIPETGFEVCDKNGNYVDYLQEELLPLTEYVLRLDNLNFGYKLSGYNYNEALIQSASLEFAFTTTSSSRLHTIEILTSEIEYHINVWTTKSVEEQGSLLESKTITMSDLDLNFETETGYYVSKAYFRNGTSLNVYDGAETDNSYVSTIYSYMFDMEELEQIIINYGYSVEEVVNIDFVALLTLHTYTVKVKYSLTPSKGLADNKVNFPNVTMTANGKNVYYIDNDRTREFSNIPYGADIVLVAESKISEGFSATGWKYTLDTGVKNVSLTSLSIDNITANKELEYQLSYVSYAVKLVVEAGSTGGEPEVEIVDCYTGNKKNQISLFDKLYINYNANSQNGYRFLNMYYYTSDYQQVEVDETNFASKTLYVLDDNKYSLNIEPFDENETYYEKIKVKVNYSAFELYTYSQTDWDAGDWQNVYYLDEINFKRNTSKNYNEDVQYYYYSNTNYADEDFNVANYYAEGDNNQLSITFYLSYDLIEMALNVQTSLIKGSNSLEKSPNDIQINHKDYADVSFSVVDVAGNERSITSNPVVKISDYKVKATIRLNTFDVEGYQYNLASGVVLNKAYVGNSPNGDLTVTLESFGVYVVEFFISDMLNNNLISSYDVLNFNLQYKIETKRMILSTNITDKSFYGKGSDVIFNMAEDMSTYGYGASSVSSSGSEKISATVQFLGKVKVTYQFINNDYNQYFKISNIKVYSINSSQNALGGYTYSKGTLLADSAEDLSVYGLTNLMNGEFDYRYIQNLYIELQVEPIIILAENPIKLVFNCDSTGKGLEQTISVGDNQNCYIQMADMLVEHFHISFHKMIVSNGISYGYSNDEYLLVDAGKYKAKMWFTNDDDWQWLDQLVVEQELIVEIAPKDLEAKIDTTNELYYEKTYNGKDSYGFADISELLEAVYFTDGNISYAHETDYLILKYSNLSASISYTYNGVQEYTGRANENGQLYNIHLTGMMIQNTNFNLINSSLLFENVMRINQLEIILTGIEVYDKVYDGTTKAEFRDDGVLAWVNVLEGDELDTPEATDLELKFATVEVGYNQNIIINVENVLKGKDASNYKIKVNGTTASIYPYKLTAMVDGYGLVEVRNDRGLISSSGTNHDLADLLPINGNLKVELVYNNSPEYVNYYPAMSNYINKNHNFVVGYKLSIVTNNVTSKIDNNLTLVLPSAERLTNVLLVIANDSVDMQYTAQSDGLVIDLSQTKFEINTFAIIQQRVLLKLWQLILIISLSLLLLIVVVVILVIVRKRKLERYSVNEKI